jgi:hypothetical protein
LVVNAAKTLAAFVVSTKEHRVKTATAKKALQPTGSAGG